MRWLWLAVLPVALAGCVTTAPDLPPGPLVVRIEVLQRDWHTDLCLARDDLSGPMARLAADFPTARFLCFGFGERTYMMEKDHSVLAMLSSLLPSRAVLLVSPLHGELAVVVDRSQGVVDVETLHVSRAGADNLSKVIWKSIQSSPDGTPEKLGHGSDPASAFYAASTSYDAMSTCNTWTATALRSTGLPITDGVVYVEDVMDQVKKVAKEQAAAGI